MTMFVKGDDFKEEGHAFMTYGIDVDIHGNKIEVYENPDLRDLILKLLIQNEGR